VNVDDIAKEAGSALRAEVLQTTDLEASLTELRAANRRSKAARALATGVAVAATVTGALAVVAAWPTPEQQSASNDAPKYPCPDHPAVRCPKLDQVVVEAAAPYTFTLSERFPTLDVALAPVSIDIFQRGPENGSAGVTVLSNPSVTSKTAEPMSARDMARWVAARPFVNASTVTRTELDGVPAWQLDIELRRGEPRSEREFCNDAQSQCRALLRVPSNQTSWESGPWSDMVSRYTFVDAPGGDTVVIWSWAFGKDTAALRVNNSVIKTIKWADAP
jgi:hypothetical protein